MAIYADVSYKYLHGEPKVFRILSMDFMYNKTSMSELAHTEENLDTVKKMKFPETMQVLQFISENNCKLIKSCEQLHSNIIVETRKSEVIRGRRALSAF